MSYRKQVCLVPHPNYKSSVVLGRNFTVTRNGLCENVLLNILDTMVSIHLGRKLGYALPMRTEYEETSNLKEHQLKHYPTYANKVLVLKTINEVLVRTSYKEKNRSELKKRWMSRTYKSGPVVEACSVTHLSVENTYRNLRYRDLLRQELEHRIKKVRISNTHLTSRDSGNRLGQGSIPRP